MKKFTLFAAVAALSVSSALAVTPVKTVAFKAEPAKAEVSVVNADAKVVNKLNISNRIEATEGEGDVTIEMNASYVPTTDALYIGFSPETYAYSVSLGLTGIRGEAAFRNMTQGADAFTWEFNKEVDIDANGQPIYETITTNDVHGFMPLEPGQAYTFPTLKATFGTDEVAYTSETGVYYFCGGALADWGFHNIVDETSIDYTQLFGVSPCSAVPGATLFPEYMISRPGASNYNEEENDANGTSVNWYAYSSEEEVLSNMVITAYGTFIPAMPSPYQLNSAWAWINSVEAADAITLPISVYAIDEEGKVDFDALLGQGELNFAAGETPFTVMPGAPIYMFEDGYAIDAPVCVPAGQAVMVCIEGLDNPNLLRFDLVANDNTIFPITERANADYLFPNHAYTFLDFTVTVPEQEPVQTSAMLQNPYLYYADDTRTSLIRPSDFAMYFDINFPMVANIEDGSANFTVEAPVEGGEVVVPVYCDYIIDALINENLVFVEASDWLTVTQAFDEAEQITNVTINAAALPAGEEGRTGYVVYEGYAIDFHITVNQGDVAGIESIEVRPVAKGTKYYDLQGRQLQAAPAAGMYIESVDGKATKRIAR